MQTLWLPGHELQLVEELQRQQNHSQFCDTVLQTQGICVPAHSGVLAAFSPYLSRQLSATSSNPSNQQRWLQLHPLKAQTLLKLVHLLYCGHMEVNAGVERTEVLAAARHFGIREVVEGHEHGGMKTGGVHERSCRSSKDMSQKDAQVQTELSSRWSSDRHCVSIGVQTVDTVEGLSHHPLVSDHQQQLSTSPPLSQRGDFSVPVTPDAYVSFNSGPSIGSEKSSRSEPFSDTETSTTLTSLLFRDTLSPNEDVSSLSVHERSSESNGRLGNADGHSAIGVEKRGVKNLTMMQQIQEVMDTTHISIKVKLRRTTKQFWEVVSLQDTDEMLSVITSLRQDGSNIINPQREVINIQPPTSSSLTNKPGTCLLQPVASATLKASPLIDTTPSDCQQVGCACFSLNHNSSLVPAPLHPPVDGTDELIEKLLEDIMMGRNILPSMDSNKADPYHRSYDGASSDIRHVPVGEAKIDVVNVAKCVRYQDYEVQRSHSTADKAVLSGVGAQSYPGHTGLPSANLDHPGTVQQSSLHQSSPRSTGRRKGCQRLLCPNPQTHAARSTVASASSSNEQKFHFPTCTAFISPGDLPGMEFYPLLVGREAQNLTAFSIFDFHLPQYLLPLDPVLNNTANCDNKMQAQPGSLQERPWLMENPGSVQFPLSAVTRTDCMCLPPKQNINGCRQKKQMEINPRNRGTYTDLCIENVAKVRKFASGQNATQRGVGERLGGHKHGTADDDDVLPTVKKRRRCKCFPQDHASSVVVYKDVNTMDGTENQINLAICSVSMSGNNVLAKEREQVVSSLKMPLICLGKPNQQLTVPASEEEGRQLRVTDKTPIKTWRGLKRAEETSIKATPGYSALTGILNKGDVSQSKRKRRRTQKTAKKNTTLLDTLPSNIGEKSHREEVGHQSQKGEETQPEKEERGGRKKTQSRGTEEEVDGRRLTEHSEHADINDEDNDNVKPVEVGSRTPKQPQMFNLKDFQELINQQHLKIRRSKENHKEINECVGKAEDDCRAHTSGNAESTQETETNKGCRLMNEIEMILNDSDSSHGPKEDQMAPDAGLNPQKTPERTNLCRRDIGRRLISHEEVEEGVDKEVEVDKEMDMNMEVEEVDKEIDVEVDEEVTVDEEVEVDKEMVVEDEVEEVDKEIDVEVDEEVTVDEEVEVDKEMDMEDEVDEEEEVKVDEEEEVEVLILSPGKQPPDTESEVNSVEISPDGDNDEDVDVTGDEME